MMATTLARSARLGTVVMLCLALVAALAPVAAPRPVAAYSTECADKVVAGNTDLSNCDLSEYSFAGRDLSGYNFSGANL